jgi:hypothetical protein
VRAGARGDRNPGEVDTAGVRGLRRVLLVPEVHGGVLELVREAFVVGAQGVHGGGAVRVHDRDRGAVAGAGQLLQHGDHRGHADAGGGEQQGCLVRVQDEVAVRSGQLHGVALLHACVQVAGDLPVGARVALHALDADLPQR